MPWLTLRIGGTKTGCTNSSVGCALNEPLKYLSPEGFDPFWNVTRYEDIKAIEGNKALFINDPRPTLGHKMITEMMQQIDRAQTSGALVGANGRSRSYALPKANPGLVYGQQSAQVTTAYR